MTRAKEVLRIGKLSTWLFLVILIFNSCKKEILITEKRTKPKSSSVEAITISYTHFLKSVNISSLGLLKTTFEKTKSSNELLSIDEGNSLDLAIYTDSVQKFIDSAGTSYVFKMKLPSPKAISFRNLTVYIAKGGKTSAFIATYTPDKQWIKDRKAKKKTAFNGDISFLQINLNGLNLLQGLSTIKNTNSGGKVMSSPNKTMYLQTICDQYLVYDLVAYGCSDGGHAPGDQGCVWNTGTPVPEGEYAGYYAYVGRIVSHCYTIDVPGGGSGGGGGGGGTSPNPPNPYDPCDTETPPNQSSIKKNGVGLLNIPPPPCDEQNPPPTPQEILALIDYLGLTGSNKDYVLANHSFGIGLYGILDYYDFDEETVASVGMTIKATVNNVLSTSNSTSHYNAISSYLPNSNIDPNILLRYLTIQCALVKAQNPSYNEWQVYWAASKEMIHLILDGAGLAPGVGEIADLANGAIYTIQGDGVNATLSYASAIPIGGWFAAGFKFAKKGPLKWVVKTGDKINFGNSGDLRRIIGLTDPAKQAHHLIPWATGTHEVVQRAAKSGSQFHMNEAFNGIAVATWRNQPNHNAYNDLVTQKLNAILATNPTPQQAHDQLLALINNIKSQITAHPNTHLNDLIF